MGKTAAAMAGSPFPTVEKCSSSDRAGDTVVADLDGTLLCGRSSFPYFAHMAFETGGVLRLLLLIALAPLAGLLYYLVSEPAGIQVLIFASMAGARVADIEAVARAVLPKFYCADLHPESWRVFSACGRRSVLTANPRVMVEAFLKEYRRGYCAHSGPRPPDAEARRPMPTQLLSRWMDFKIRGRPISKR